LLINHYSTDIIYNAPLYIQKAILFLLQKGTRSYHIVFGGLFVLSMETAAMVKSCQYDEAKLY